MDSLTQTQKILARIVQIGQDTQPFGECLQEILELLIQETDVESGCILAEFEHEKAIHGGIQTSGNCGCDASDGQDIDYATIESTHGEDALAHQFLDNGKPCGLICLCGRAGETTELEVLLRTILLPFVEKLYIEKKYGLREKYFALETRIQEMTNGQSDSRVPSLIRDELDLESLVLLDYDRELSRAVDIMGDCAPTAAYRTVAENTAGALMSSTALRKAIDGIDGPTVFTAQDAPGTLFGLTEPTGEVLVSPLASADKSHTFIMVAVRKEGHVFVSSQLRSLQRLTRTLAASNSGGMVERAQLRRAGSADLIQRISRRIIDDSDIDIEAEAIREELDLHSCLIFLLDRVAGNLRIEGISSKYLSSASQSAKAVAIDLDSLYSAGYSLSDFHQQKTTTVDEYAKLLESTGDYPELLSSLQSLRELTVVQIPLFDTFRRMQGLLVLLRAPETQVGRIEEEFIAEMSSKISGAFEIRKNIYFDTLTELPNVKRIRPDVVDRLISFDSFSLIMCKIINLEDIVLARGDEVVDECMIELARRMKYRARSQPREVHIGRNSGEASFILIYPGDIDDELASFSSALIECIAEPIDIRGDRITFSSNIGICHSTDIRDTDMVFNYCKLAIQSIADQQNAVCVFNADLQLAYEKEKELEGDLRDAISRKQFVTHYQPKVLCDGTIAGYEALVRWTRDDHIEYPGVFVDRVEKMGMIHLLFEIVLEQVCQDLKQCKWIHNVSVNISPSQLVAEDLHSSIESILSRYQIEPGTITFEFVETAILDSRHNNSIKKLKSLGFRLSLDDFGTGYARYKTLLDLFKQGFVDEIKIDKVFTDDIETSANQNFIRSICFLAQEFDVSIVAEGVETADQFAHIRTIDPGITIQGWLVSKALPVGELGQLNANEISSRMLTGGQ